MPESGGLAAIEQTSRSLIYADALVIDDVVHLGTTSVTEAEIIRFAMEFDPLTIHVDLAAADAGPFGGLVASGIHTLGLFARLQAKWMLTVAVVAGRGSDRMRLPNPVRPDEPLSGTVRVVAVTPQSEERAVVDIHGQLSSPAGVVLDLWAGVVMLRRPSTGQQSADSEAVRVPVDTP